MQEQQKAQVPAYKAPTKLLKEYRRGVRGEPRQDVWVIPACMGMGFLMSSTEIFAHTHNPPNR